MMPWEAWAEEDDTGIHRALLVVPPSEWLFQHPCPKGIPLYVLPHALRGMRVYPEPVGNWTIRAVERTYNGVVLTELTRRYRGEPKEVPW